MAFENFPYTDLHTLNLDWLLRKLEELESGDGTNVDDLRAEMLRLISNLSHLHPSGPGWIRMVPTNETGCVLGAEDFIMRNKNDSAITMSVSFNNQTGSTIPAGDPLLSFEGFPSDFTAVTLRGMRALLYKSDNSVSTTSVTLKIDSNLNKLVLVLGMSIPDNCLVIVNGYAPVAVTSDAIMCRGMYPEALAQDICNTYLHGTTNDPWYAGSFDYSNDNTQRLDESYRATDCSGMVYIAYKLNGFKPSRGAGARPYWNDGCLIAYADAGEELDLSLARAGDVICYQDKTNLNSIPHCTLYLGDDTVADMSSEYPARENAAGCIDGKGPYHITSTPARTYRNYSFNRYVVRFL